MRAELLQQKPKTINAVDITRRLVQIPSFVDKDQKINEGNVMFFVRDFIKKNTNYDVKLQEFEEGRYNLIATNSPTPRLALYGHMDTVKPAKTTEYNQFEGKEADEKLYGLGSVDMKSGVGALLSAIASKQDIPDVMLILTGDEEYDFKGMRALLPELKKYNPDLLISTEPTDMQLRYNCRGFIELQGYLRGKTAHAGTPSEGINAVEQLVDIYKFLQDKLGEYSSAVFGTTTVNLSNNSSGREAPGDTKTPTIGIQNNAVPDITSFTFDIRPAMADVTIDTVTKLVEKFCLEKGISVEFMANQEKGLWFTNPEDLSDIINIVEQVTGKPIVFSNPQEGGYVETQMLADIWPDVRMANFGPGPKNMAHKAGEYVDISTLKQCEEAVEKVMENYRRDKRKEVRI